MRIIYLFSAAYCDVTDWKCGAACNTEETKGTRLIKFFQNSVPRDNNAYGNYYNDSNYTCGRN